MTRDRESLIELGFEAVVIHWRGPSPYFFAALPAPDAEQVRRIARAATYGWGVVPVEAEIGDVAFTTSLFPKDETYLVPIKAAVRARANITAGDAVTVALTIRALER
jgi:hypothetical protein